MKRILFALSTLFIFSAPGCDTAKPQAPTTAGPGGGVGNGSRPDAFPSLDEIVPTASPHFDVALSGKTVSGVLIGPNSFALLFPVRNGLATLVYKSKTRIDPEMVKGGLVVASRDRFAAIAKRERINPLGKPFGRDLERVGGHLLLDGRDFACNGNAGACEDFVSKLDPDLLQRYLLIWASEKKTADSCVPCTSEGKCEDATKTCTENPPGSSDKCCL